MELLEIKRHPRLGLKLLEAVVTEWWRTLTQGLLGSNRPEWSCSQVLEVGQGCRGTSTCCVKHSKRKKTARSYAALRRAAYYPLSLRSHYKRSCRYRY